MIEQSSREQGRLTLSELLSDLTNLFNEQAKRSAFEREIVRVVEKRSLHHLLNLAGDQNIMQQVSAGAWNAVGTWKSYIERRLSQRNDPAEVAHNQYLLRQIDLFESQPENYKVPSAPSLPDGSPIGCGHFH